MSGRWLRTRRAVWVRALFQTATAQEDRIIARANLLSDCAIVCTEQIGGPAAAKLVARHIHPVKTVAATPVTEFVQRLQGVLRGHPAPWLRKAMGLPPVPLADSPDQTA